MSRYRCRRVVVTTLAEDWQRSSDRFEKLCAEKDKRIAALEQEIAALKEQT